MRLALLLVLASTYQATTASSSKQKSPVVNTVLGPVQGGIRYSKASVRPVYSFFGIKYGRNPDYMFRFRPPTKAWDWKETRDVSDESRPPLCYQDENRLKNLAKVTLFKHLLPNNYTLSEDCLTVDVFTPYLPCDKNPQQNNTLPVIAWIHGGSFQTYVSTRKLWAIPSMEDVVLVQIQYRLGPFGFLTTEDKWAVQNVAYHDQIKGLKWVRDNIAKFGGDPTSVTLMGMSAGSLAVTAHMLSPLSTGLFHKAVALSGAIGTIPFDRKLTDLSRRVAKRVGCHFPKTSHLSTCLQNKIGTKTLMDVTLKENAIFTNIMGGSFMPEDPEVLLKKKMFSNNVPLIIGSNNGENEFLLSARYDSEFYFLGDKTTRTDCLEYINEKLISLFPNKNIDKLFAKVIGEYLGNETDSLLLRSNALDAIADALFVSKAHKFAQHLSETGQNVFLYQFSRKPSYYQGDEKWQQRPFKSNKADHGDDFAYLFGIPFIEEVSHYFQFSESEKNFSANIVHTIAAFAKSGSPKPEFGDRKWDKYPSFVVFENDSLTSYNKQFQPKKMKIWNEDLPVL